MPESQTTTTRPEGLTFSGYKSFKNIKNISQKYKIGKELGHGCFGSVYEAVQKETSMRVAIKTIKKKKLEKDEVFMDLMIQELEVLQKTDHPNITRVFELLEDDKHFYVVMEYIGGGDLMARVTTLKKFTENTAASVIYQVLLAINYMHSQNVCHRDLKPENLMCVGEGEDIIIKLTDFGFACFFDPKEKLDVSLGTPIYMAPEMVKMDEYDQRVDVWSIGIIAYMLLCGKVPFDGKDTDEIRKNIIENEVKFEKALWKGVSKWGTDFVCNCLRKDLADRPQVSELLEHRWIKDFVADPTIGKETQLQIQENLHTFRQTNTLQSGVLSIMSNLLATSEELKEYIAMFRRLDKSNDGFISLEEMKSGLKATQIMGSLEDDEWDEILKAMDTNGDGKIDFNEFVAATFDRKKLISQANIKAVFDMFDQDRSGTISMGEMMSIFGKHQALEEEFRTLWQQIVHEMDCKENDEISFDEFSKCMEQVLKMVAPTK